jgi:hypothetical protein
VEVFYNVINVVKLLIKLLTLKNRKMKTPHLDEKIRYLEETLNNGLIHQGSRVLYENELHEYKAIKKQLENNPIVSTPENPVWVVDERGYKRILLADLGEKSIGRYLLVSCDYEESYLNGEEFDWYISEEATPYTEKVTIEVTKEEAIKVEEFLKGLRDGK